MKNRILIAEEHKLLRQGLRALISTLPDFEVIGECQDGKEAVRLSTTLSPAVLLMDLSVPGLNGIEATAQIKRRQPEIKVVALTSHNTGEYVREALRAGADGYILKDASYDELVMALRSVASGKKFLSPDLSGHQPKKMRQQRSPEHRDCALGQAHCTRAQHSEAHRRGAHQPRHSRIPPGESEDRGKTSGQPDAQTRAAQRLRAHAHSAGVWPDRKPLDGRAAAEQGGSRCAMGHAARRPVAEEGKAALDASASLVLVFFGPSKVKPPRSTDSGATVTVRF